MLHLQPCIRFDEHEPIAVHQKLDRAGIGVARRFADPHRRIRELRAHRRRDHQRRRDLDDLLPLTLQRALAITDRNDMRAIANDLNFDVPRVR